MFIWMNQRERGVWKYGFQLYTGMSGYPILDRAKTLIIIIIIIIIISISISIISLFILE